MSNSTVQYAYGLGFRGLPKLDELAQQDGAPTQCVVDVQVRPATKAPRQLRSLDGDGVVRHLQDGRVLALRRKASAAILYGTSIEPAAWAHPYLAPIATTFSRWNGREAFHAGAFVAAGRSWVVLGAPTAGKSTLLAALARRGLAVLSDDIVVTDGSNVFAGPRCVDLRDRLPDDNTRWPRVRMDSRWRVQPLQPPRLMPLGGWFFLGWGRQVSAHPIGGSALIRRLARGRSWRELSSDPSVLLSLATRPAWDLVRPRSWESLEQTLDLVEATIPRADKRSAHDCSVMTVP